ncbi:hypothetical protein SLEP1_g27000 [Rubroshorea leprosula]|uniref:Adenosine kinase n=1 Tax=Rubroshorea leprosula TaxID=152421 RepID=A0AAV5JP16_9ROSI|nr:hypothetical protein SLEP1_g27000 [Rubroshorea leprosula]
MTFKGIFLGMGNPLLDISAVVDEKFLKKYDIKLNNAILAEDKRIPMFEEMASKYKVEYIAGGATQNSIEVSQWMLQIPGEKSYMGCIGKDKFGKDMKKNSKAVGFNDESTPTGTCVVCVVCVVGGERSLVAHLSTANCYTCEHLKRPDNWALVEKAKYFYIAEFFLIVFPDSIQLVAGHAAANNKDAQEKVLPQASIIFFCTGFDIYRQEPSQKVHGWETDNVDEIALKTSQWPTASGAYKRITVIT